MSHGKLEFVKQVGDVVGGTQQIDSIWGRMKEGILHHRPRHVDLPTWVGWWVW